MGGVRLQGKSQGLRGRYIARTRHKNGEKPAYFIYAHHLNQTSDSLFAMLPLPSCPRWWADSQCSRLLDTEAALWVKYLRYLLWLGNARSSQRQASMQIG
jgi:hypothetical protein